MTGILSMYYNLPFFNADGRFSMENVTLNLQSPQDIVILRRAPWWTPFKLGVVIAGALVLLCLGFGWNLYLRRRMRIQAQRLVATMREKQRERIEAEASRRERLNLAHDLHDGFQQLLAGTMFRLEAGLNYVEEDPAQARSQIEKARTSLEQTQNGLRAALWGMVEESEGPKTLSGLFRFAASRLPQWQGKVEFSFSGKEPRLARKVTGAFLLILQEAIGNALKHGGAEKIVVATDYRPDGLIEMRITDDGCGFVVRDKNLSSSHLGIRSMKDRAERLGGTCVVESELGKGTCVSVKVKVVL